MIGLSAFLMADTSEIYAPSMPSSSLMIGLGGVFLAFLLGVGMGIRRIRKARKKFHTGRVLWVRNRRAMSAILLDGLKLPVLFDETRRVNTGNEEMTVVLYTDKEGSFAFAPARKRRLLPGVLS